MGGGQTTRNGVLPHRSNSPSISWVKFGETDSDSFRWLCEQWDLERCDATGHGGEKNICIRPLSKLQMTWDFAEYLGGNT